MYTLFTFYRSREWAALLAALKQERVNDEGQIVCEYCGKPIVRAYDMIGHHKEELTEEILRRLPLLKGREFIIRL